MNNHMTLESAKAAIAAGWRPMPGRCIIHLDRLPDKVGSIHIPDASCDHTIASVCATGTVLAVTCKPNCKTDRKSHVPGIECDTDFIVGDHILLNLYASDLDHTIIITRNTVILAVIGFTT